MTRAPGDIRPIQDRPQCGDGDRDSARQQQPERRQRIDHNGALGSRKRQNDQTEAKFVPLGQAMTSVRRGQEEREL